MAKADMTDYQMVVRDLIVGVGFLTAGLSLWIAKDDFRRQGQIWTDRGIGRIGAAIIVIGGATHVDVTSPVAWAFYIGLACYTFGTIATLLRMRSSGEIGRTGAIGKGGAGQGGQGGQGGQAGTGGPGGRGGVGGRGGPSASGEPGGEGGQGGEGGRVR